MTKKTETKDQKPEDKEVAVSTNTEVVGADLFDLKDNMEGVEARLPQIKIIHQGQMFAFPDETKKETFEGIILDMNRANAWWKQPYGEGGGDAPDCYSMNGVNPDPMAECVQSEKGCAACEHNKYGSDGKRGKSCKNMKRCHILITGNMMPYRLSIPPSSLKAIDLYVSILTSQGTPYQLIKTTFGLKTEKNKESKEYSELTLKPGGSAVKTVEEANALKALIAQWKLTMREQVVLGNEYMAEENS